jgi:hypothetical protein
MKTRHLSEIQAQYRKTIDKLVAELTHISEETQSPLLSLGIVEIIDNEDRSLWHPFMSIVNDYACTFRSTEIDIDDIKLECIEDALQEYKNKVRTSFLLERMKEELRSITLLENEYDKVVKPITELLIEEWQGFALNNDENYNFREDGKELAKAIINWSCEAELIIEKYATEISKL